MKKQEPKQKQWWKLQNSRINVKSKQNAEGKLALK